MDPLTILEWLAWALLTLFLLLEVVLRVAKRFHHIPAPALATKLIDNPLRRRLVQSPERTADQMRLAPGMTVVEIGPGKGSYTAAFARRIAPGTLHAVDIQPEVVERLRERMKKEGIANVDVRAEDAQSLSLPNAFADRVILIACLAEIPDPVKALREAARVLKPGGLVVTSELLPDPDYPLRSTERRWAAQAGLEQAEEYGNAFVYQLHFRKKNDTPDPGRAKKNSRYP
jgi:ubiquinone/menaquinone biosynthesis C-methylase UbiE